MNKATGVDRPEPGVPSQRTPFLWSRPDLYATRIGFGLEIGGRGESTRQRDLPEGRRVSWRVPPHVLTKRQERRD
jgi:hypothetical protein